MGDNIYIIFEETYRNYGHHLRMPNRFFYDSCEAYQVMDHLLMHNLKDALSYSSLIDIHKKSLFHIIEDLYKKKEEQSCQYHYVLDKEELFVSYKSNCIEIFLYKENGSDYMQRIQLKCIRKHVIDVKPVMLLCAGIHYRQFTPFDLFFFSTDYEASSFMHHHYDEDLDALIKECYSSESEYQRIKQDIDYLIKQGQEVVSSYSIKENLLMCFIDETQCYMDLCIHNQNCIRSMEVMQLPH